MNEREVVAPLLAASKKPRFMDLGAHVGDDSEWLCRAARTNAPGVGIAVEADPDNFNVFLKRQLPILVLHSAIASYTGTCDFWVCDDPPAGRGSGSIRQPTGHLVRNGVPYTFRKISIPCITLDDLFEKSEFGHLDVLWVDIQGGEKDMIQGGQNALKHTRYMLIESEYAEEFYAGQAMRPELLAMLPDWVIQQSFDFNLLLRNEGFGK
jgi:FkbM family methyltransferase